jgi:hypothetical protein
MTKKDQNFTITAGDTKYLDFTVDMDSSTLVGSTIKWVMKKYDEAVITKTTTGDISITAAKVFRVTLDPADTLSLVPGQYDHQAEVTDVATDVSTVAEGTATIEESLI